MKPNGARMGLVTEEPTFDSFLRTAMVGSFGASFVAVLGLAPAPRDLQLNNALACFAIALPLLGAALYVEIFQRRFPRARERSWLALPLMVPVIGVEFLLRHVSIIWGWTFFAACFLMIVVANKMVKRMRDEHFDSLQGELRGDRSRMEPSPVDND